MSFKSTTLFQPLQGFPPGRLLHTESRTQAGGQPGHSTDESIFVIKSLIARAESSGKGFIFSLVDIVGFFDKEQILDVMDCLD